MPSRTYSSGGYRYGFNGKESDYEVKNIIGTSYDYGFRIYDPRLAKFLSVDPLTKDYSWYTPYQFSGNSPILNVDLDGLEELDNNELNKGKTNGQNNIKKADSEELLKKQNENNVKNIKNILESNFILLELDKVIKTFEIIKEEKKETISPREGLKQIKSLDLKELPTQENSIAPLPDAPDPGLKVIDIKEKPTEELPLFTSNIHNNNSKTGEKDLQKADSMIDVSDKSNKVTN